MQFNEDLNKLNYEKNSWYVLSNSGYVGPFNQNEIISFISKNMLGGRNLVWHSNLSEWAELRSVTEFTVFISRHNGAYDLDLEIDDVIEARLQKLKATQYKNETTALDISPTQVSHQSSTTKNALNLKKVSILLILMTLCLSGLFVYFQSIKPNVFMGFPELSDQQNQFLKFKSLSSEIAGQQVGGFVYSNNRIYASGAFANNTKLTLKFRPINHTFFENPSHIPDQTVVLKGRAGQSKLIGPETEKSIPPGYYTVSLYFKNDLLFRNDTFISQISHSEYIAKLNEFNEQKKKDAEIESLELSQMIDNFKQQSELLFRHFTAFQRKSNLEMTTQSWKLLTEEWLTYQNQISTIVENWNLDQNPDLFYRIYFQQLAALDEKILKLKTQIDLVVVETKSNEIKRIEREFLSIQAEISRLKSRIDYLKEKNATE